MLPWAPTGLGDKGGQPCRGHPIRKRLRLSGYNYASPGAYFVTVCTRRRTCILGSVGEDHIVLSPEGEIVRAVWQDLPRNFPGVDLDAFVVMPNHVHGILILLQPVGAKHASPQPEAVRARGTSQGSLPAVIQAFKSAASRSINKLRGTPGAPVWQRGYYEHIIRSSGELDRLRAYIETNPLRWALDRENPGNV